MRYVLALIGLVSTISTSVGQTYGEYDVVVLVQGNGFAHQTAVYFDDYVWAPQNVPTYGWETCCDVLLAMGNANQPHIFTQVVQPPAPTNSNRLSVNGLPLLYEHTPVPLGFLPGTLAPYTFTFQELYSLPAGAAVELEDLSLNVTQDLLADSTYETWGAPSDDEERFIIHFYPPNVTSLANHEEKQPSILAHDGVVIVNGLVPDRQYRLEVYDVLGKMVEERILNGKHQEEIYIGTAKGAYVVSVITHTQRFTSRIML